LETPEVHTPHAHHGGGLPRWLELVIAVTALVTSISSIAIAVHHGHIMEKLVEANSLPFMQGGFSDTTLEGAQVISLDLVNPGVGPAHEKSLRVKVDNRYVRSVSELLIASLGPQEAAEAQEPLDFNWTGMRTRFIGAGKSQFVFRTAKTEANAKYWDRLAAAQPRWSVDYCYCSVFEECWRVKDKWSEPEHVKECKRDEATEFLPQGAPKESAH
jgi:hypothetical protein